MIFELPIDYFPIESLNTVKDIVPTSVEAVEATKTIETVLTAIMSLF